MSDPIKFYAGYKDGVRLPHASFNNFASYAIEYEGVRYRTSEHFYQAMKFPPGEDREEVIAAPTAKQAALTGRQAHRALDPQWEARKDDVMRLALFLKFSTYAGARAELLSTGDREIIEDSPTDYYWGCGADGTGKNMLGKLLMETRERLRTPTL